MSVHAPKQPPPPQPPPPVDGVVAITPASFAEFINSSYAVVWAGRGCTPAIFPYFLQFSLGLFHFPQVKLGAVDSSKAEWASNGKLFTAMLLGKHGLKIDEQGNPPPGFYLFANGTLLGFEPNELGVNTSNGLLWAGAATAVVGLLSSNLNALHLATQFVTWKMGERVAQRFEALIGQHLSASLPGSESHPRPRNISDPIRRAYQALGLSPDASDQEVSAAHKRLVMEHHPDRAGKTQEEQSRAHRRTAEVNAARDAIKRHRDGR